MAEYEDLTELEPGCVIYRRAGSKKGTWHYRLSVPDGYLRQSTHTTDRRRAMRIARERWQRVARRVDAGKSVRSVAFEVVAEEFMDYVRKVPKFAGSRRACYVYQTKNHLLPAFRGKAIDAIFDKDVKELIEGMEGKGLAASSINNALTALRILFDFAIKKYIEKGDVPDIENVSLEGQDPRSEFSHEEIDDIISSLKEAFIKQFNTFLDDDVDECMRKPAVRRAFELFHFVNIMASTGMRPSSIRRLRAADVRIIDQAKMKVVIQVEARKGGKRRQWEVVPLRSGVDNILLLADGAEPSDLLFTMTSGHLSRLFTSFLKEKKIHRNPHGLARTLYSVRHYYINWLLEHGVPIAIVAKNAMTSVQMIERYYEHMKLRRHHDELAMNEGWIEAEDLDQAEPVEV